MATTKSQSRVTKRKLTAKNKKLIRSRLEEQKQEILDLYQQDLKVGKKAADQSGEDLVDRANSAYNREFMFSLTGTERQLLIQIEEALVRLDNEIYGVCVHCSNPVSEQRLQAVAWARYCIDCQELEEKGLLQEV